MSGKTASKSCCMRGAAHPLHFRLDALSEMLDVLRDAHDGAEGYLKTQCGFSNEDVAIIRENLRIKEA